MYVETFLVVNGDSGLNDAALFSHKLYCASVDLMSELNSDLYLYCVQESCSCSQKQPALYCSLHNDLVKGF